MLVLLLFQFLSVNFHLSHTEWKKQRRKQKRQLLAAKKVPGIILLVYLQLIICLLHLLGLLAGGNL